MVTQLLLLLLKYRDRQGLCLALPRASPAFPLNSLYRKPKTYGTASFLFQLVNSTAIMVKYQI